VVKNIYFWNGTDYQTATNNNGDGVWIYEPSAQTVFGVNQPWSKFAVSIQDAYGNVVTSGTGSTDTISLTIASGPSGGALGGITSAAATSGVATFDDVTASLPDTYTLTAIDATESLEAGTSSTVTVGQVTASQLVQQRAVATTAASVVVPLTTAVQSGDTLIASVCMAGGASVSSITDTLGGRWMQTARA
jgi:hypothetical protein